MTWKQEWSFPPNELVLSENEIHLWRAWMPQIAPLVNLADLSAEERQKLARLTLQKSQTQFAVSHWATRKILSRYLNRPPNSFEFTISDSGKPALAASDQNIQFNRSHSGDFWLLAITKDNPVGVDIEQIRERPQISGIVDRWFTSAEKEHFHSMRGQLQLRYFFSCWTKKEALLKATGSGLTDLAGIENPQIKLQLTPFCAAPDFPGCVAGETSKVVFFDFKNDEV